MAKTINAATISPLVFVPGRQIFADDAVDVLETANYTAARIPETLAGAVSGGPEWEKPSGTGPVGHRVFFLGAGFVRRYIGMVEVCPDVKSIEMASVCFFQAAQGGEVQFKIDGTIRATHLHLPATNYTPVKTVVLTGTIGTGRRQFEVLLRLGDGSDDVNMLTRWRISEKAIISASDLPDPTG